MRREGVIATVRRSESRIGTVPEPGPKRPRRETLGRGGAHAAAWVEGRRGLTGGKRENGNLVGTGSGEDPRGSDRRPLGAGALSFGDRRQARLPEPALFRMVRLAELGSRGSRAAVAQAVLAAALRLLRQE